MQAVNHIGFISAAYAMTVIVVGALIVWVALDYRIQRRRLADFELRGITRRSAAARAEATAEQGRGREKQQAKEQA